MTYQLELEIDNDDTSFVEEFFRSVAFVKTIKRVSNNKLDSIMPKGDFIVEKSAEEIIAEIRNSRSLERTRNIESF
ncbi:MAG: hypothetical protein LBU62_02290 [Bacteroidales bacterium]|jgi:hypothetical protein|nr:hypothetical protein [Bacteroidales bacterium]